MIISSRRKFQLNLSCSSGKHYKMEGFFLFSKEVLNCRPELVLNVKAGTLIEKCFSQKRIPILNNNKKNGSESFKNRNSIISGDPLISTAFRMSSCR